MIFGKKVEGHDERIVGNSFGQNQIFEMAAMNSFNC
jgi:hypothetical protein